MVRSRAGYGSISPPRLSLRTFPCAQMGSLSAVTVLGPLCAERVTQVRVWGGQVRTSLNPDRFGQVPGEPGPNLSDPVHEATNLGPGSRRVRTVRTGVAGWWARGPTETLDRFRRVGARKLTLVRFSKVRKRIPAGLGYDVQSLREKSEVVTRW